MRLLTFVAPVLVAALLTLAACAPPATPTPTFLPTPTATPVPTPTPHFPFLLEEGFERGLGSWRWNAAVPQDANNPGHPVPWSVLVNQERAAAGASSSELFLDGRQGPGAIWLEHSLRVNTQQPVQVQLSFHLWSETESFNTLARVAAYAGPRAPEGQGSFDTSQVANLASGWREYAYTFTVTPQEGLVWVALGVRSVWETEVTYAVDEVRVGVTLP